MDGCHRPPHVLNLCDPAPSLLGHPNPHLLALDDRLVAQSREIDVLLMDNQSLAATHVTLKQEVLAARAKAEQDREIDEAYERTVKVGGGARAVESVRDKLAQVRVDLKRMVGARDEMVERLKGLRGEVGRVRADRGKATTMVAEIEVMQKEVHKSTWEFGFDGI